MRPGPLHGLQQSKQRRHLLPRGPIHGRTASLERKVTMKIYGHPMSTCTRKVLTTLVEKSHEPELVVVDFATGEHKKPAHMSRQPFGQIPTLEDGGFTLYESRAMMRYIDETKSGPKLTP